MFKIVVTAPGKTILHGEHAVVYGKAAIATSLGLKTRVSLSSSLGDVIKINLHLLKLELQWDVKTLSCLKTDQKNLDALPPTEKELQEIGRFMDETIGSSYRLFTEFQKIAVTIFLYLYGNINSTYNSFLDPCEICVESDLSLGAGMGSSASYSVCLATTLLAACKVVKQQLTSSDLELISKWAFCAETICHGWPSGIDNAICTYGGALLYENKKIVSQLPSMPSLQILLVNTGVARNTKVLVAGVKQKLNAHSVAITHVLDAINAITLESWELLKKMANDSAIVMHMPALQDLMKMNQHLLNCLGVSHPKLNLICDIAESNGCAAKLTGAGGGGCAFIIVPSEQGGDESRIDSLKASLTSNGLSYWEVLLGGKGVQLSVSDMEE